MVDLWAGSSVAKMVHTTVDQTVGLSAKLMVYRMVDS